MPTPTFANLSEDKRTRIIEAMKQEFATYSYTRASIDRMTAAAGISKGSFYQYFEDKRDAYAHLVEGLMRDRLAVVDTPVPEASLEQVITALVRGSHGFQVRDPLGWSVLARAFAADSPLDPAALTQDDADLTRWVERAVRSGQDDGELRADVDPATAAWMLVHVMAGLPDHVMRRFGVTAERAATDGSAFDRPEIAEVAADTVALLTAALAREEP